MCLLNVVLPGVPAARPSRAREAASRTRVHRMWVTMLIIAEAIMGLQTIS